MILHVLILMVLSACAVLAKMLLYGGMAAVLVAVAVGVYVWLALDELHERRHH